MRRFQVRRRWSPSSAQVSSAVLTTALALLAESGCSKPVNALYIEPLDGIPACGAPPPGGPTGVGPSPSAQQVAYQRSELTAYIHFGLETFDDTEDGSATDTPSLFNPTNLDVSSWVSELENAGFRQVDLVVKHSTGFCLWPSAYTSYSVRATPWQKGQGDVVRAFTDAMHAAGMRVGFYVSPWDRSFKGSAAEYRTYFANLLTELLTNYGPVYEVLFPGFNVPSSLDWQSIAQLAHRLQPQVLVWTGPENAAAGADLRYINNQEGRSSRSLSSIGDVPKGPSNVWYPAEAPVSDRGTSWFWHSGDSVMSASEMESIYFNTVGMNATLLFNVPPAQTGQFDTPDIAMLRQFAAWYQSLYQTNLLKGQPVTADSTWANPGFDAANATDDNVCTYWAAAEGQISGRLEITPASPVTPSLISIREPIELGERTTAYHIELKQDGAWNRSPLDASGAKIQGTVIGQRQLWRLNPSTVEAVALVIESAKAAPAIAELGVY